jgi:hypothetical protein
MGVKWVSNW